MGGASGADQRLLPDLQSRGHRGQRRRLGQGMKAAAGGQPIRLGRGLTVRFDVRVRGQEDAGHVTRLSCRPCRNLLPYHLYRRGGGGLRGGASSLPSVSLSWEVPFHCSALTDSSHSSDSSPLTDSFSPSSISSSSSFSSTMALNEGAGPGEGEVI